MPYPRIRLLTTHTPSGDPQTHTGRSGSVSCGFIAPFFWILVHKAFCCPPRVSVSPSPMVALKPTFTGLQSQIPWEFPVPWPDLQTEEPYVGP